MSKFAAYAEFTECSAGYHLLPFRLNPLSGHLYFISNMAGEGYLLERSVLVDFVHHKLDTNSEIFRDLVSKNFAYTDDSQTFLELLPLKLRTKTSRLQEFTSLHIFVVTLRCEHSCPYCQVSRQSGDKLAFDMSEDTALRALSLAFRSPSKAIKIEFQGGEPLLNFPLIRFVVEEAVRINVTERKDLAFVVTTNLAVITDEIIDFCRAHDIHISTSLDGPRELHNANRPRPGNNSYELAVEGIQRCRDQLGRDRVNALMTTTKRSLGSVISIIDEYVLLGFEGIFLRPLSPYGFAVKTKWFASYDSDEWLKFYREGLDYIVALNERGFLFKEFMAATILRKMLTPFETGYVDLMSPAGIGIAAIVYNYDGDVYASDESRMLAEMGDKRFCLGNVHASTYDQIFTSDALLNALDESFAYSSPMCTDCAFEPYCGSEPVYHHATQQDYVGFKPDSGFCKRSLTVIGYLIDLLNDREKRKILLKWIS